MKPNCPFDEDPNAGERLSPAAQKAAIESASNPAIFLDRSMTRRDFLKAAAAAWFSMMLPVRLFRSVANAAELAPAPPAILQKTLVLLELNGGNDGLNTIIPFTDDRYYDARKRIAIPRDQVVKLSHHFGFHPSLAPLLPMWQEDRLAIIHGVGYPKPNRSHFRSIAIWETGSDADEYIDEGWLARLFRQNAPAEGTIAEGIVIGNGPAGPLSGPDTRVVNMERPEQFLSQSKSLPVPPNESFANPALAHILDVEREIHQAAAALGERIKLAPLMKTEFPKSRISNHLQVAAKLIASRTPVPVIKLSHGSFDTHSGQVGRHVQLLKELGEGLAAFENAMKEVGLWDTVLIMTYSEFGRRVSDNDNGGTDHGTAAPHVLMGGRVKGGFYGEAPSLTRLTDGDLEHHVDYRSLYETVAHGWWGMKKDFLPRRMYGPLRCIR